MFGSDQVGAILWVVFPALHMWSPSYDFPDRRWRWPVLDYDLFLFTWALVAVIVYGLLDSEVSLQ
jgi:hypothetical protein